MMQKILMVYLVDEHEILESPEVNKSEDKEYSVPFEVDLDLNMRRLFLLYLRKITTKFTFT
jgi:hypothetical protein